MSAEVCTIDEWWPMIGVLGREKQWRMTICHSAEIQTSEKDKALCSPAACLHYVLQQIEIIL